MNPIFQALNSGHSPQQILEFLSKAIPGISPMVAKATGVGYTAKQILGFLSKNFETEDRTGLSESARHAVNRRADAERMKFGLKLGASALAAPLAGAMAQSALSRALPAGLAGQPLGGLGGPSSPNFPPNAAGISASAGMQTPVPAQNIATQQIGSSQPPIPPTSPAGMTPSITQPPVPAQAIVPKRDIKKSVDLIKNIGQEATIKNLIEGGLPPRDIAGVMRKIMEKDKLKAIESIEGGLESAIEDYAQSIIPDESAKDLAEVIPQHEITPKEIIEHELIEEVKPIQKNQTVVAPQGIGEVKAIRNGKAIVEIDGKKHQVNEEDLEPTIHTEEQIAQAYNNLMDMIPEEHKSGFIQWAGYDEDRNVLGFIPRGGKYEELHNITPEEAKIIKEGKGIARTTGETREGMWAIGEDTRGGLISQIIHDRRKKHKASEEKQLKLGFELPKKEKEDKGMKPLFDELAFARNASREMDRKAKVLEKEIAKKKKEEEIARIKKEREEAKKRKKQA